MNIKHIMKYFACTSLILLCGLVSNNVKAGDFEAYTLIKDLDDYNAIIEDKYGQKHYIEYGVGCLSLWRYEGKTIYINSSPYLLNGISDKLYLIDDDDSCTIWDAKEIDTNDYEETSSEKSIYIQMLEVYEKALSLKCKDAYEIANFQYTSYFAAKEEEYREYKVGDVDGYLKTMTSCIETNENNYSDQLVLTYYCSEKIKLINQEALKKAYNDTQAKCEENTPKCINGYYSKFNNSCYCNPGDEWDDYLKKCVKMEPIVNTFDSPAPTPTPSSMPTVTISKKHGYHGEISNQSGYPTVRVGETALLTLNVKNTGTRSWNTWDSWFDIENNMRVVLLKDGFSGDEAQNIEFGEHATFTLLFSKNTPGTYRVTLNPYSPSLKKKINLSDSLGNTYVFWDITVSK